MVRRMEKTMRSSTRGGQGSALTSAEKEVAAAIAGREVLGWDLLEMKITQGKGGDFILVAAGMCSFRLGPLVCSDFCCQPGLPSLPPWVKLTEG